MKEKPSLYNKGQNSTFFNVSILMKILIQTSLIAAFILFFVYYSSELTISEKGLMPYEQWSGNLVMAVIVVSCNVRIILMSHQLNIMQGFLCLIGPLLYFLLFYIIGFIVSTDSENTLEHQMSTGLYWILLIFNTFIIESIYAVDKTITNLRMSIEAKEREMKETQNRFQKQQI